MKGIASDVRLSVRLLRRRPQFCIFAVSILTLGIGATTCIFSAIQAVLLNPLPFAAPGRLVAVEWVVPPEQRRALNTETEPVTYRQYLGMKAATAFSDVGAMRPFGALGASSLVADGTSEQIQYCSVTHGFFEALQTQPVLGRRLAPDEFAGVGAPVAVLSYDLWKRRFGGRADALGQTFKLDGQMRTVVGVMPPDFRYDYQFLWMKTRPALWIPENQDKAVKETGNHMLNVVARLKPGVSLQQAQAEMSALAGRLPNRTGWEKAWQLSVSSLHDSLLGRARASLHPLMAAVALLLLIACANLANLLLAQGVGREAEVAIRTALGAGRGRIIRQLLTETVALSLSGGLLGVLLAWWGCRAFNAFCVGSGFDWPSIRINAPVLGFAILVSLAVGLLSGLAPALRVSRANLNRALSEGGRSATAGVGRHALSRLLVISEVALSCVLLIGAGLLIRSLVRLWNADTGLHHPERVLTMSVPVRTGVSGKRSALVPWERYLEEVGKVPGVQAAAFTPALPAHGAAHQTMKISGRPDSPTVLYMSVSQDYFETMGIELRKGRFFARQDGAGAPPAAVISEGLARKYWPDRNPVGSAVEFEGVSFTVVGVAADVRQEGLGIAPEPQIYLHDTKHYFSGPYLAVRTALDPQSLVSAIRRAIKSVDPEVPVSEIRTLDQALLRSVASRRLLTALLASLAGAALLLAAAGIFAVLSHTAKQRTAEMGIRTALGARPQDILWLILSQGLMLVGTGVALGIVAGMAAARLLATQLFGITAGDPVAFATAAVFLLAAGGLACYLPARRTAYPRVPRY